MSNAKKIALCGIMTATCIVILLIGAFLGLGIYAAPMFAGLLLIPIGKECGIRFQLLTWLATGLLCLLFVPDLEEKLMFVGFLGWYPVVHSQLAGFPKPIRIVIKLVLFNGVIIAIEAALVFLLTEVSPFHIGWLLLLLLLLANAVFLLYDKLIPRITILYTNKLRSRLPFLR